jgi:type IV pilus assembly protein PilM
MASVWGIDIGKAALKAVKLRRTKEGLEIQAIEHIEYPIEDDEDERQEHVNDAVTSFLAQHKLGSDQIVVGIPGLHAFSRFINLPPVDKSKVAMMVRMEAQQQIPFPIAEVNWDYVQIDREYMPGEELEVGIFATRSELIDGFLSDLAEHDLAPDVVTIAPLAVYNFVRHNTEEGAGATIVLDIGAEHTDLVIIDGEKFWIRNLRIAGNDITKALAERFKIPFAEAEKLKRSASKSPQAKKIFSSMQSVLKDLVGEIHRSVGFFKSQAEELDIQNMLLLGDGARLKNLPKFLKQELKYPVKRVSKLEQDNFIIDPDVDLDLLKKHLLSFAVPIGLAMQGTGEARCSINLAPQALQLQAQLKSKVPFALGAAVCAWAALGLSYTNWTNNTAEISKTLSSVRELKKWDKIQKEAEAVKDFSAEEKAARELGTLGTGRHLALDFLNRLQGQLGEYEEENKTPPEVEDRTKPLNRQIDDLLSKEADRKQSDKRMWLLHMDMVPLAAGAERGYRVVLHVAKPYARGTANPAAIRDDIKGTFVTALTNSLIEPPFSVRSGPALSDYGEMTVSTPEIIYGLDKGRKREPDGNSFECVMVTVTFEIGFAKPKPQPAPEGGEEGN